LFNFLNNLNFQQLITDTGNFLNKDLIIAVYVDDIIIIGRKIPTEQNTADVLTKGLDKLKHYEMMGLKKIGKMFTSNHSVRLVTKNKPDTSVSQIGYSQFNR
jgi:hypothetical protein